MVKKNIPSRYCIIIIASNANNSQKTKITRKSDNELWSCYHHCSIEYQRMNMIEYRLKFRVWSELHYKIKVTHSVDSTPVSVFHLRIYSKLLKLELKLETKTASTKVVDVFLNKKIIHCQEHIGFRDDCNLKRREKYKLIKFEKQILIILIDAAMKEKFGFSSSSIFISFSLRSQLMRHIFIALIQWYLN